MTLVFLQLNDIACAYTWTNVVWGGGGYVTGITYHPKVQGLVYARTDVGGSYRRDPGSYQWIALNDDITRNDADLMGVASLAVDPNNSQRLYLACGMYLPSWGRTAAILRSMDRGATWSRTELPIRLGGNSDGRGNGERMQVDPNLGSVLYLATNQDGLYTSTDSGVTWTKVTSFTPTATTFVLFQQTSSVVGSATKTIYVGVAVTTGTNLYRSTDSGKTWSAVPNQPTGLMPLAGAFDSTGYLFITYSNGLGPNGITTGAVYRFKASSTTWTNVSPQSATYYGYSGVSVSSTNVLVSTIDRWGDGDDIFLSKNSGSTWTSLKSISQRSAPNNPWLTSYHGGSLSGSAMGHWITDVEFDPFNGNHVIYNTGFGAWETQNALNPSQVNWAFNVSGIEETVVNTVISPNNGAHLFMTQGDVGGARYNTNFNDGSGFFPNPTSSDMSIDYAQYWDFIARTESSSKALLLTWDNGANWWPVSKSPVVTGSDNGKVAVSAANGVLLWVPGGQGAYFSRDNGASWTASIGYPTTGSVNSGSYFTPVSDKTADGYFYTYDFSTGRLLQSSDSGATFTVAFTGLDILPSWASQSQLVSIPGTQTRELWLGNGNGLYHINGLSGSPVKIGNIQAAYAVGFGAAAPGKTYPALYISGMIANTYGIYQSINMGVTWTRLNDNAHQFNSVNAISGDQRVYGQVYLSAGGRGTIKGSP